MVKSSDCYSSKVAGVVSASSSLAAAWCGDLPRRKPYEKSKKSVSKQAPELNITLLRLFITFIFWEK